MKKLLALTTLAALGIALAFNPWVNADTSDELPAAADWDKETLEVAATLPVQNDGRVKPLDTYASFLLLRLNGKRSMYDAEDNRLEPIEWYLDCIFYPETAREYKCFLVENDEVLDAIGMNHDGHKKRDRYSYNELEPTRAPLMAEAAKIEKIEPKDRDLVQGQLYLLARNMVEFESAIHYLDFARSSYDVKSSRSLEYAFPDAVTVSHTDILDKGGKLAEMRHVLKSDEVELAVERRQTELTALDKLERQVMENASRAMALAILPPPDALRDDRTWITPADLTHLYLVYGVKAEKQLALLRDLEGAARADAASERNEHLRNLHSRLTEQADARGEYDKIPMEVSFYKRDYFYNGLALFILSFVLVALSWLRPDSRLINWGIKGSQLAGLGLVIAGITVRCIIRGRPPVSTLYETILFITATAVIVAMITEWINRARVAEVIASVLGMGGLFMANRYEAHEAVDTMPQLLAVLDTNFWLATHVTTVTLGYSAGLLASAVAHLWLFGQMFGLKKGDAAFYRGIARMTYGILCFGLVFSVIGTILGGIWANDSWGRFWGWDPKENGALMIVLWELALLHARMGGYIKNPGFCLGSIFGGIIVAFSWWGVNLLGVGLHSYGFTAGVVQSLYSFYAIETLVLLAGGGWLMQQRMAKAAAKAAKAAA